MAGIIPTLKSPSSVISLFEDDSSRWQAVASRNSNADGFFVYAVKTTKIFCRPICKARLARRANVRFYDNGLQAQTAGFRACKRCKPEVAGFMPEEAAVQKIRGFVQSGELGTMDGVVSLSRMARQTGLSKWHFHRVFKRCVGVTPTEYLRSQRRQGSEAAVAAGARVDWLGSFDTEGLEPDFDFAWLDELGELLGAAGTSSETGTSPWTIDDLVAWPEDGTDGTDGPP